MLSALQRFAFALFVARSGAAVSGPRLLFAAALGQAIGIAAAGRIAPGSLALGLAQALALVVCVVALETWSERETDAMQRRIDPDDEEPRAIADGLLEARSLLYVGLGIGAVVISLGVVAELLFARPGAVLAVAVGLVPWCLGTLPPLRLRDRGGGELLEMIAVGFALPWWHAYLQSGIAVPPQIAYLPGFALLVLAGALARGLADEDGDRLAGKRTFVTWFGAGAVRGAAEGLVVGAMLVWAAMPRLAPQVASWWTSMPAIVVMAFLHREVGVAGRARDVDAPTGARRYEAALFRTTWFGAAALAITLALGGWLAETFALA
ncbi:MAG TPA: UbiA family prenyltransferase [Nannocystaceae bacterium]|nr:UbiA family prenyltransferase [Nannocystaceae bacterium]